MTPAPTLLQEAQAPNTSAKRLREIYQKAYAVARISSVAEAVTAHPNTPPDLLRIVADTYPKALLQNPALPLILLEDPAWAQKLYPDAALALLRFENVPVGLLYAFAEKDGLVGDSAKQHVGLAGEAGPDWESDVREALWNSASSKDWNELSFLQLLTLDLVPEWLLEPLAAHSDSRVRQAVARSPRTPPGLLTPLRRAGSASDLGGLAPPDPALPVSVLTRLARGGPWAKRLAARHPNTPAAALEALVEEEKAQSKYDKDKTLCRYLMQNPNTPAPFQAALAVDFDTEFQRASARDPNTPPVALAALSISEARDVRWMAARNPNTPPEALQVLAEDTDARVRQGVGRNTAAPPALLTQLAIDPVRWVRLAAARHPQTPPATLALLATDSDEEVQQSVARRRQSLPAVLRQPKQPRTVPAMSPRQAPLLKRAPMSADPAERAKVLSAVGSYTLLARTALLACPDVALNYLASAAIDDFWPLRLAVARNPAAFLLPLAMPGTDADLHTLSRDGNRLVRAAARAALQTAEKIR